jgi:polysaccharide pyruvyl transferase WcaK-like protein
VSRVHKTIALLDHLGYGNLGDDANLDAVIHNIRSRWPQAKLIGLSLNPYDTERRHGIPSYAVWRTSKSPPRPHNPPVRPATSFPARLKEVLRQWHVIFLVLRLLNTVVIQFPAALVQELLFVVESFRIVRSLDLLIVCGGGQLLDWGGPWAFPYALFKWTLLAKLSGVTSYYVNVGAGPLRDFLSKFFVRHALLLADYASFRDEKSRALTQEIGFRRTADVFPDNVYSLEFPILQKSHGRTGGPPVVGITPMAYRDPRVVFWDKDQTAYNRYIRLLGLFAASLVRERHRLRLFSTEVSFDSLAIEDLRCALRNDSSITDPFSVAHDEIPDGATLFSQMSDMDYIVTSRFHGVVFAHLMTKPVLAISPHPKVATLMNDAGLSAYCVDIRTFDVDSLKKAFDRLLENQDDIKRQMTKTAASYRARLLQQYDHLFPVPPIAGRRPTMQVAARQS